MVTILLAVAVTIQFAVAVALCVYKVLEDIILKQGVACCRLKSRVFARIARQTHSLSGHEKRSECAGALANTKDLHVNLKLIKMF